jgi:hypothetical protein
MGEVTHCRKYIETLARHYKDVRADVTAAAGNVSNGRFPST